MRDKMPRPSSETERLELKAATRRALSLARVTAFAMVTRVDAPALSKYGAAHEDGHFMPLDVLLDLERDIGAPVILETLAALQGYRLVPLDGADDGNVTVADLVDVSSESGDVVHALGQALADGNIDPAEKRDVRHQITENITVLRKLDRKLSGV